MKKILTYLSIIIFTSSMFMVNVYASDSGDLNSLMNTLKEWPFTEIYKDPSIWRKYEYDLKKKSYRLFNKVNTIWQRIINKRVSCNYVVSSNVSLLKSVLLKCKKSLSNLDTLEQLLQEIVKKHSSRVIFQKWNLWYSMFWYIYYKVYLTEKSVSRKISNIKIQIDKLSKEDDLISVLNELDNETDYNRKELNRFLTTILSSWYIKSWNKNTKEIKLFDLGHGYILKSKIEQIDIECRSNNLTYSINDHSFDYGLWEYSYSWWPKRNLVTRAHGNHGSGHGSYEYITIKKLDSNKYNRFVLDMYDGLDHYIKNKAINTVINCSIVNIVYKWKKYNFNYKLKPVTIIKTLYN